MAGLEEVFDAAEAEEAAKTILEEEEVILEEVNFNKFLEPLMGLDSSTSEMEPGLNITHLLTTLHTYSESSP